MSAPLTLFPRQEQALSDVQAAYASGHRAPILRASTGFGKTHCAVEVLRRRAARGRRGGFLSHREEINADTIARLRHHGIPHGCVMAGVDADLDQLIQVISVQSAVTRLDQLKLDFLIVDECHLAVAATYRKILDHLGPDLRLLGLTATPQRLDNRGLREAGFDTIVETAPTHELVGDGSLCQVQLYRPSWNPDQGQLVGDALEHWQRLCEGRRGVAFCQSVAHAQATAERFQEAGYRAMAVSGRSSKADRREAVEGLREGRLDLVACADLWIAGVDVRPIDAVLWLRRTMSLTNWLQGNGRGMRTSPETGKTDLIILDFAGNSSPDRLGHPLARHSWSLDGHAKAVRHAGPADWTCSHCLLVQLSSHKHCTYCGQEPFLHDLGRAVKVVAGELVPVSDREARAEMERLEREQRARERAAARTPEALVAVGKARGMKNPHAWARHVLAARRARGGSAA